MKNMQRPFRWQMMVIILCSVGVSLLGISTARAGWPNLIYPSAEGITLVKGKTYTILWKSVRLNTVNIGLCTEEADGLDCFSDIAHGIPNTEEYSWKVPTNLPNGPNYVISVGIIGASLATSNSPFTISDSLPSPLPPTLTLSINELNVSASWGESSGAKSYTLYYAAYPYADGDPIGSIDMGNQTRFSVDLWRGASYYVAVRATNEGGSSDYSNIELLMLDK